MLANDLHYRATLFEQTEFENDVEAVDQRMEECGTFWCSITPTNGKIDRSLPGEVTAESVTHKITIRRNASPRLSRPGGRQHTQIEIGGILYDVLYVLPHYADRDRMVIYAQMRAE